LEQRERLQNRDAGIAAWCGAGISMVWDFSEKIVVGDAADRLRARRLRMNSAVMAAFNRLAAA